jgi:hypothetical protein
MMDVVVMVAGGRADLEAHGIYATGGGGRGQRGGEWREGLAPSDECRVPWTLWVAVRGMTGRTGHDGLNRPGGGRR